MDIRFGKVKNIMDQIGRISIRANRSDYDRLGPVTRSEKAENVVEIEDKSLTIKSPLPLTFIS